MSVLIWILWSVIISRGVCDVATDVPVSVTVGESATLDTGIIRTQKDRIRWYFNNNRIAELNEGQMKICTDDVCPERFRGRLQLDNTSGSLIITKAKKTDSGPYQLQINSRRTEKKFIFTVQGPLGADTSESSVSVMEGDSVTLCTGVQTNQNNRLNWYFNKGRIAEIIGYRHKICTDNTCPQRFRDRLKLDSQIGSLTIMKVSTADSGLYTLLHRGREKNFRLVILDNSSEELENLKQKSVPEGESITLDTPIKTTPNDVLKWYFGKILLAEITGDQSRICEDVEFKDGEEGFSDRLKANHSSGSLTIMNSRKADSGEYTLLINSTSFYISRRFSVIITFSVASVLGLSLSTVIGICAGVLVLLTVAAIAIYFTIKKRNQRRHQRKCKQENGTEMQNPNQNSVSDPNPKDCLLRDSLLSKPANLTCHNQEELRLNISANQTFLNQKEPQLSNTANQTSNNQEPMLFIDEGQEDEYIRGTPVIHPEKGVIL
ncbi:uncharacterized protein LOC130215894 isoform X1 [Danio aesculapii]|uniref:uncharacterized protein LOC130215894 isoform X1 n=1 Tax=Danio aesculapii TaxID=1142201 RepID=UPI0024C0A9CC|nr:uncharacterized protein LOC130215894 isoform X1 [Danio aesculapii]